MHARMRKAVSLLLGLAEGNSAIDACQISPARKRHRKPILQVRKIDDLSSRIALLSLTRNCCFVVYLSTVTASLCAGSTKHVRAATPASQNQAPRLQVAKKSVKRKTKDSLYRAADPALCTVGHRACPNHGCGIHAKI
jgi:hypothetical protein